MTSPVCLVTLALVACSLAPEHASNPSAAPASESVSDQATARPFDHEHALWSGILQRYVSADRFAYGELAREPEPLRRYLAELQAVTPEQLSAWTREQQYAFWINAYNAHTVAKVVDNWPLESIRKLDKAFGLNTVFDQAWIPMEAHHPEKKGAQLSLNDIEHGILRPRFTDARVHAAINCASEGCPPLLGEAFVAARLEEQLESQMRAFVSDPARNRFDHEQGEASVSEVFKWFAEDFERDAGSVRDYLIRFAPAKESDFLGKAKIRYLDYSWDLNDAPSGG